MENLSKSFFQHPRQYKLTPFIGVIGFVMGKRDLIDRVFGSYNYSFIMRGTGIYRMHGIEYRVEAPCVITQWPGEKMYYGPDSEWDEIFFIYPTESGQKLESSGLFRQDKFIWKISDKYETMRIIKEIHGLCVSSERRVEADRIDLLCCQAIVNSLSPGAGDDEEDLQEKLINDVAEKFRLKPGIEYDLTEIASECGMSLSTFRRLWLKYRKIPPARFIANAKVDEACRMLSNSTLSINRIADVLNFSDSLYFSRFFRQKTGLSASEYRKLNSLR